jgi:hypothetical protein
VISDLESENQFFVKRDMGVFMIDSYKDKTHRSHCKMS